MQSKDFVCEDMGSRRLKGCSDDGGGGSVVMPTFLVSRQDGTRLESMMPLIPVDYLDGTHLICEEDVT